MGYRHGAVPDGGLHVKPGRYIARGCICGGTHAVTLSKRGRTLVATFDDGEGSWFPEAQSVTLMKRNGWSFVAATDVKAKKRKAA